jgi:hypothetical protein
MRTLHEVVVHVHGVTHGDIASREICLEGKTWAIVRLGPIEKNALVDALNSGWRGIAAVGVYAKEPE